MADVANHLGVSRALVSIVFRGVEGASDATRQRVLEAAAELGYRPDSLAQGLRRNRSRTLGVLFSLRRPFEVELVEHMYPIPASSATTCYSARSPPAAARTPSSTNYWATAAPGWSSSAPNCTPATSSPSPRRSPSSRSAAASPAALWDVIRNDDAIGTRQAVDHLVALGHRAIAYVDGGLNPGAEDRRDGYRAAMTDHGLEAEIRVVPGGYTEDEGADAAEKLLSESLPTAVIAANDPCAIGFLDTVLRTGVAVPGDLSVVGYDDSRFGRLPGIDLTSVRQDIPKMARLAVKAVVERLDKPNRKPKDTALPPKLVVRGTTAAPGIARK
jgi:DNA-binding LacI/PurR family transcriptional regulator